MVFTIFFHKPLAFTQGLFQNKWQKEFQGYISMIYEGVVFILLLFFNEYKYSSNLSQTCLREIKRYKCCSHPSEKNKRDIYMPPTRLRQIKEIWVFRPPISHPSPTCLKEIKEIYNSSQIKEQFINYSVYHCSMVWLLIQFNQNYW